MDKAKNTVGRPRGRKSGETRDGVVDMVLAGKTCAEMGKALGYTKETIYYYLRTTPISEIYWRLPGAAKNKGAYNHKKLGEITQRIKEGARQAEVAKEVGLSRERVRQILSRAGLMGEYRGAHPVKAVCPRCGGKKSPGVEMCASCKKKGNRVEVECGNPGCGKKMVVTKNHIEGKQPNGQKRKYFFCCRKCLYESLTWLVKEGRGAGRPKDLFLKPLDSAMGGVIK